jgi:hypothetical protein
LIGGVFIAEAVTQGPGVSPARLSVPGVPIQDHPVHTAGVSGETAVQKELGGGVVLGQGGLVLTDPLQGIGQPDPKHGAGRLGGASLAKLGYEGAPMSTI